MRLLTVLSMVLLAACASAPQPPSDEPIPPQWLAAAQSAQYPQLSYGAGGVLLFTPRVPVESGVRIVRSAAGAKLVDGDRDLTPEYADIDSFDVSMDRREVAFSAKRKDNFDIGLVSLEGSKVSWVPEDPADEVGVQYAPRGNKISFIIRARGGDLVRTVHIPTSMQLTNEFPYGRVEDLAWEPKAEQYAVSWSSVDASDRVEVMTYSGRQRKVTAAPSVRLDVSADPLGGSLLLRPTLMRYGEKLPLVVWRAEGWNEWNDARGRLESAARVVCAVIDHDPDQAFWKAVSAVPWIDTGRVFVVGVRTSSSAAAGRPRPADLSAPGLTSGASGRGRPHSAIWIVADASVPPGFYRTRRNIVAVAPALVQSFGAAWIAHQLKGHPPENGSHR